MKEEKIACAVFSFDRPDYFKQVLDSFLRNENHNEFDWYFFQDASEINGKKYGDINKINKNIELIENFQTETKELNVATANQGIAKQKQKAHHLFQNYNKIIFFEDDMIVSKYYLRLLLQLSKEFPNTVIQASDRAIDPNKHDFIANLSKVHYVLKQHWWGYLMPKSIAKLVIPTLNEYINFIGNDYRKRPDAKIRKKYKVHATSHDAILETTINDANQKRLATFIPRAKYIGKEGLHSTSATYKKQGFEVEKMYEFEEDKHLENFGVIE